jgi:hypothetical protein
MFRDAAGDAIHRRTGLHVVQEMTVNDAIGYGRGEMRGKRPRNSGGGRIDLVALDSRPQPTVLIELKRSGSAIHADARRLRKLVKRGSARFGLIAIHALLPKKTKRSATEVIKELAQTAGLKILHHAAYSSRWNIASPREASRLIVVGVFRV